MIHRNPRWPYIIGAIVCAGFTIFALFRDVRTWSDIGASQAGILVAVTVAIIAGYGAKHSTARSDRTLMWFLFIACTFMAVGLGTGRTGAMLDEKQAISDAASTAITAHKERKAELNVARHELKDKLPSLERTLADAQKEQKSQCARKNNVDRCDGATAAMTTASEALTKAQEAHTAAEERYSKQADKVIDARPPPKANTDLNSFTQVLSLVMSRERANELVLTLWPFLLAVVAELGLITFTHLAFSPRDPRPVIIPAPTIKERRADPSATITIKALAEELSIQPKLLRKKMRASGIDRPIDGWKLTRAEADAIKRKLAIERGPPLSVH